MIRGPHPENPTRAEPALNWAGYTYDALSRRSDLDYANGAYADYSYDTAGRTLYVDNRTNNGQHKYAYTYDYVGNRGTMQVTDSGGSRTTVYTYDATYQLTAVDYPAGFEYLATDTTFAYDAAGNRTSVIDGSGTTPYSTNNLNQYTAADGVTYKYDPSGNMNYDGHNLYRYDPENRLTKVTKFEQGPGELAMGCDTDLTFTTGGNANWTRQATGGTFENDCVKSGAIGQGQESWMQTTVSGPGTVTFYWSVSSEWYSDYLKFYIDGQLRDEISGYYSWTQKSYYLSSGGTHTFKWVYAKSGSGAQQDCGYVDRVVWTASWPAGRTLADAVDSFLTYTTGGNSNWFVGGDGYFDVDDAKSGDLDYGQSNWLQTTVTGPGTFKFWWKASSENNDGSNMLRFRIDGVLQDTIYGEQEDWQQKTYTITGTGAHTLQWTYSRGSQDNNGWGWVDYVQWSGPLPQDPPATGWRELVYVYDASGRRIEKKYNSVTVLKYIYDGDSCIAEYDAGSNLRRKYIYGPGIDQPVCMIEATVSPAATYYYHFDALGSVVALTNSSGNTVEVYDYAVYGQVGASDATHPNRFMFTGREFDKETGLYYYRARYYKPEIGRFLQADSVGYGAGMNLYRYCRNNPWNVRDPFGNDPCTGGDPCHPCDVCDCNVGDPCSYPGGSCGSSGASPSGGTLASMSLPICPLPIPTGPTINPVPPDSAMDKCPQSEADAKSKSALCKDTALGQALHSGTCYRQMVKPGSPGLHCCYVKGVLKDDSRWPDVDGEMVEIWRARLTARHLSGGAAVKRVLGQKWNVGSHSANAGHRQL